MGKLGGSLARGRSWRSTSRPRRNLRRSYGGSRRGGEAVGGKAEARTKSSYSWSTTREEGSSTALSSPAGSEEVKREHAGDELLLPPLDHNTPRHRRHLVLQRRRSRLRGERRFRRPRSHIKSLRGLDVDRQDLPRTELSGVDGEAQTSMGQGGRRGGRRRDGRRWGSTAAARRRWGEAKEGDGRRGRGRVEGVRRCRRRRGGDDGGVVEKGA
uniref:Uncharacterized protein n=1 Tax=Oryza meridionalis TaxID=40149 RepID=A0A0E0BZZ9_9ORYZ